MRRFGPAVAILAFVLAAPVGVLYLAVPPNETAEEGPADPIRGLRRPVLVALRALGLVDPPGGWFCGSEVYDGEGDDSVLLFRMELDKEPVYRGLFFRVGHRVAYKTTDFTDERDHWQVLRLCYAVSGKKFVAGEGTPQNGMVDPDGRNHSVRGYVPCSADGFWVEGVDQNGKLRTPHAWGHVEEFWRDDYDE